MEESQVNPVEEEEKEEGELEDGELEDDEGGEETTKNPSQPLQLSQEVKANEADRKVEEEEERLVSNRVPIDVDIKEEGKRRESKEGKEEKKRKHRDDDEEREKRKKKKKKKKHVSSDDEEEDGSPTQKFLHHKIITPTFDGNMGFDAMLQQEMLLRGRSPPAGMMPYGAPPPGPFNSPHPGFPRSRPMSDYDSFESGSDSEMRERHERRPRRMNRRYKRSRSRSRSPSRKNEAFCMYYMHGSCQRGRGCPYSHDIQPQRKMELCKFYLMDCCAKKMKCLYMHKDFPCKYYHTGLKCKSAEKCKFSHDHLTDAARNVLLKHIELAPKDILGDFPRLTKEAAHLVVAITEAHRRGSPMDVENIPGAMEIKGRGFKYVDKAIKNLAKRQEARMKNMQKEQFRESAGTERVMSPEHPPMDRLTHQKPEDIGVKSPPREMRTPPQSDDMVNGELPQSGASSNTSNASPEIITSMNTNMTTSSPSQSGPGSSRKLGGFMTARMPQMQRELFQRIEQQHSVHHDQEDITADVTMDEASTSNVNWYSSDEDGDGSSLAKMQGHNLSRPENLSPSRTPPMPSRASTTSSSNFTSGRQGNSPVGTPSSTPPQKGAFPSINLDSINISSDLASVLSALKNQNAASTNRSIEESGRDPRVQSPRGRDPREPCRDMMRNPREVSRDHRDMMLDQRDSHRESRDIHRNPRDMFRDSREMIQSPRSSTEYSSHPWARDQLPMSGIRDPWDRQGEINTSKDLRDQHSNFPDSREGSDLDRDQRQRTGDVDLRVLPGVENNRTQGSGVKGLQYDTDLRIKSEPSIYDVDLRQLNLPNAFKSSEEEMNSLPFKVPVHTPAKEIFASISSHSPMYYQLTKVTIPKPNFSHLKINKDDPRILEDPRLRRMLRRNSTEEVSNRSPRAPSRYDVDSPLSPPSLSVSKGELRFSDSDSRDSRDSRDPRMPSSRDPRSELRADPRAETRVEPRVDPRINTRVDPRVGNRGDLRGDSRDPRAEQLGDMRNQDPRMSGMFGGGNSGGMMEGGMQFMNMGPGPMNPMVPRGVDPRNKPGLLGPAPMTFGSGVPMGPRMPPFMMGPNGGFYPEDTGEMMGGGGFSQGGPGWGGRMPSNDPRLQRDMGDGNRSYTPPPVS